MLSYALDGINGSDGLHWLLTSESLLQHVTLSRVYTKLTSHVMCFSYLLYLILCVFKPPISHAMCIYTSNPTLYLYSYLLSQNVCVLNDPPSPPHPYPNISHANYSYIRPTVLITSFSQSLLGKQQN